MRAARQPIYLLADSQLLFKKKPDGTAFLASIRQLLGESPRAAYLGASNGDVPQFYDIFRAAMEGFGISHCKMLQSSFPDEDVAFLERADLILLAGGEVERGWSCFVEHGIDRLLAERYAAGAVLIGVSAGAVQLGAHAAFPTQTGALQLVAMLQFLPCIVDVHDERTDWQQLASVVRLLDDGTRGIGIPTGGGIVFHPDHSIEVLQGTVCELLAREGRLTHAVLVSAS